jgi:hypothetical protein
MFQNKQWLQDFETLPPEKQAEVVDFIQFLKSKQVQAQPQKEKRPFGVLKGEVWMSDDFDAPLEDFAEYM